MRKLRSLPVPRRLHQGFTLMEFIIVIVVTGLIAGYAAMRNSSPSAYTLVSQAQKFAADLRHAQTLAITMGRSINVHVDGGSSTTYWVSCATSMVSPCNTVTADTVMTDPATGRAFSYTLTNGIFVTGPASYTFDSFGKTTTTGTYSVKIDDTTNKTVTISNLTGTVQ